MMNKGDSDCSSGLSQRIFDFWTADSRNGFVSPLTGTARDIVKSLCWAVARAVVDEIQANATVSVSTPNVQGGADTRAGTGTVS